jgi:serine/threonine-protein kinase
LLAPSNPTFGTRRGNLPHLDAWIRPSPSWGGEAVASTRKEGILSGILEHCQTFAEKDLLYYLISCWEGDMPRICPACGQKYDEKVQVCPKDQCPTVFVSAEEALVGKVIDGRFTLRALLGVGGMGAVYKAHQHSMDREVALKVLRPDLARSEQEVLRFFREARAASKLSHPNIITVFDFGQSEDGLLYMVMELLQGKPLSRILLEEGAFPWERATNIIFQTLDALAHAHSQGILHRDLKPDNIFLVQGEGRKDLVKVLDFGIAKVMGAQTQTLTGEGMVVGTPAYMSPEQAMGEELDQRSDLYSLGTIFFETLTGKKPFEAESPIGVLYKKVHEEPPKIKDVAPGVHIPPAIEDIIREMLRPRPGMRPKSAIEVKERLQLTTQRCVSTGLEQPLSSVPLEKKRVTQSMPALSEALGKAESAPVKPVPAKSFFVLSVVALCCVMASGLHWALSLPTTEKIQDEPSDIPEDTLLLPREIEEQTHLLLQTLATKPSTATLLEHLAKTCEAQTRYKVRNLFVVGAVLRDRLDEIKATLLPRDASLVANYLGCICPDCPEIQRTIASLQMSRGAQGFQSAFKAYWRSFSPFSSPKNFAWAVSSWGLFLLLTSLCLFLFFTGSAFLRHYPEIEHGFRHAVSLDPDMVGKKQDLLATVSIIAFLGAIVFLPFSAGLGLFFSCLLLCLVLAPFISAGEAVLLGFVALFAAGSPIYARLAGLPLGVENAIGQKAWQCLNGDCRASYFRDLKDHIAHHFEKVLLVAFSAPVLRVGMDNPKLLDEAEGVLSSMQERPDLLLAHLRLMKGVSDTVGGEVNAGYLLSAEDIYLSIAKQERPPDDAFVGLALVQAGLKKRDALKSTIETMAKLGISDEVAKVQALQLELEKEEIGLDTLKHAISEMLKPPNVPDLQLYTSGLELWSLPVVFPGKGIFLGRLPVDSTYLPCLVVFVCLLPLVKVVSRRYPIPSRCVKCSEVTCKKCNIAFSGIDLCPTCLLARVRPTFVSKGDARQLRQSSRARMSAFYLLVPGVLQTLLGKEIRGVLCSFIFLAGLVGIFETRKILPADAQLAGVWAMLKGVFLLLIAYGWTLHDYLGERK